MRDTASAINVLLVEDSPIVILAQKVLLEEYGFTVEIAKTGKLAIQKARNTHYHLIIMDLGLPDIDGIDVTKSIKAIGKNTTTPIVALTAHHKREEYCLNAGMLKVFSKPLTLSLCQKIRSFICGITEDLSYDAR